MSLIYYFCKKHPEQSFKFLFILIIKGKYFPFVYFLLGIINGSPIKDMVAGIIIGHLYLYLKDLLPISTGKTYVPTPLFM
jgi:Derlin-2/3